MIRWLCGVGFLTFAAGQLQSWDLNFANRTVWFSSAAYCDPDTYTSRTWVGLTAGFECEYDIVDRKTDTHGYIGYFPDTNEIYVVFRGSQSLRNWITNMQFAKADYPYPFCSDCLVHSGFYDAEQAVIKDIIQNVGDLSKSKNTKNVVVTGHSLGAALATLTAIDLLNKGYTITVYNIGSPRVGDENFASFAETKMPDFHRIVHDNDMVPQVPLQSMNFHHLAYEYFEDKDGNIRKCDNSGEDPTCSDQYTLVHTSVDAHGFYLSNEVDCTTVSTAQEAAKHQQYLARLEAELREEARLSSGIPMKQWLAQELSVQG